ncbi:MAG: histidine kinase, partial [Lachnospiraceae bacterium]|nr:histidine kinase [Lachnospiraceae bacterium]
IKIMKKKQNIQRILSSYFILLMTILFLSLTIVSSLMQYRALRSRAVNDLEHYTISVGENIDLQINQLDTICLNAINSSDLKDTFKEYTQNTSLRPIEVNRIKRHLTAVLMELKGFDYSIRQLNIYDMNGNGLGVGNYNGTIENANEKDWFEPTIAAQGRIYIDISMGDIDTDSTSPSTRNNPYFSIYRLYYNNYHVPQGIIGVKKYYDSIFKAAASAAGSYHPTVYVYDTSGSLIYPADIDENNIYPYYANRGAGNRDIYNSVTGKREYCCFYGLFSSGFTLVTSVQQNDFLAPVYRSIIYIFITFLVIFALCIFLSSYLSVKISNPIRHIYHFLESNDSSDTQSELLVMEDSNIREIDKLRDSLNESLRSRNEAIKQMLVLNEQEVQAQMLALQSQMNPHFLYNSLSSIAEMANEGHTDQVEKMVYNISHILRYISSNREQLTSIEEELELCDMYLECMKLRYSKDLKYEFDVEDIMLDAMIPKLSVQLLVENAIKSVTTTAPPWNIKIKGEVRENLWFITVTDNGPGFNSEVDTHLRKQMDSILETGTLPSLKIEGMGILNIFIRLYLIDGITFIFDFGNNPEGGAFVTIGRKLSDNNPKETGK